MSSLNPSVVICGTLDPASLLERAQAGDAEAFGEICRVYETRLLRQAMTLCGNATLAEELAHDTLVEAWKSVRRYNGRCQFFTWLCAILLNRYRNTVRQKRPTPVSSLASPEQDELQRRLDKMVDGGSLPDQAAQLREQTALVMDQLQLLPPKHQQIIYLRFYVDDSLEEIAAALDCSVGTVKSRLFRALDKLRGMNGIRAHFANLKAGTL